MNSRFTGKVAIVTGAGNGIGFEIARQLVKEGGAVVLNDINGQSAEDAARKISQDRPGACIFYKGDAGKVKVIKELVELAVAEFGRLDFAIANAGITLFGEFFDITEKEFQNVVDVNLKGSFFLAQHAAKQMKEQNTKGRVLLMSSTIGCMAYPKLGIYSVTKAGLHMMARSLVLDLSPHGITINAIAPGATLTERTVEEEPDYENFWKALIPKGKIAVPNDIAKAALFLLSEDASHITGQTLVIDGGWTSVGHNYNGKSLDT
ncbi:SDR family NAD(P)-dependent oxidoreductase [Negadavirga shengliensis]|uniref:SDR family NAD(P)-dependent oxidoreductase n=1 Tax=Negadavirga shengliensis TaxID=1389218 RepID=A0ABV9T3Y5_9BACT